MGDLGTENLAKDILTDSGRFWPAWDRPKSRPKGPRWRQNGDNLEASSLELAQVGLSWGQDGDQLTQVSQSWNQLGAKLAQDGPSWD